LVRDGVFAGNGALQKQWLDLVVPVLTQSGLQPPAPQPQSGYGGRRGQHTPELTQALADLQQVRRLIPQAAW
jgi:1,2-phenylacetyl-CoA epoxidase catalytic subunit